MQNKNVLAKGFFFAFAAILAFAAYLQIVAAANPVIFDGSVVPGYKYKASTGDEFTVSFIAAEHKIVIDFPGESLVVKNQTCNRGTKLEGCFDGAKFKGYNYSLPNREVYELKVKLSQVLVLPDIKIGKNIEREELEVGEETTVFVNVTNIGPATATVYFGEKIPPQLSVKELPDQHCQLSTTNTLSGKAELKEGQQLQCNYKVTALAPGTYLLQSSATYDAIKTEKIEVSVQLKVKSLPLSVDATYNQTLILGDRLNITLMLKSDKKIDSLKFNAFIPNQLKVISTESGDVTEGPKHTTEKQKTGLKILNSDKLTSLNGSAEIIIISEAVAVGEFPISTTSSWSFDSLKQEMAKDFPVNVTFAKPYFRLDKYDNKTGKASVDLVNPAHLPIYNVSITSDSFGGANNQALSADMINSLSYASFDVVLTKAEENYTGTIQYYTRYGQKFATQAQFQINASILLKKAETPANETPAATPSVLDQPAPEPAAQQPQQPQQAQEQKKATNLTQIKVAAGVVAVVVVLIIAFLIVRSRGKGEGEPGEPGKLGEETET